MPNKGKRLFPGRGSGKRSFIINIYIYNFTRCTGGRRHVGTQFMDTGKQVALLFGHGDETGLELRMVYRFEIKRFRKKRFWQLQFAQLTYLPR